MSSSLDQFVEQRLKSGAYPSYEAMVEAGLRLLQEREAELDQVAEELRPAVTDYLKGNHGTEIKLDVLKARGRQRLAAS